MCLLIFQLLCRFHHLSPVIWGWVKTLVPSEPQNSWDLWMFIPLKCIYRYWPIPIFSHQISQKSECPLRRSLKIRAAGGRMSGAVGPRKWNKKGLSFSNSGYDGYFMGFMHIYIYTYIHIHIHIHVHIHISNIIIPRSSFVALFSGRLGCWLLFEISVRKSSSSPKRLLLQFTYDFPGFISCCITMLRIQPHSILCQLNSLMWAIDKTKWSNDKWPASRQGQPPPTLYPS